MEIDPVVVQQLLSEGTDEQRFFDLEDEDPIHLGVTHVKLFTFCPKVKEDLARIVNREIINEALHNVPNADDDHVDAQFHRFGHFLTDYDCWIIRVYADEAKTRYTPAFEKAYEFVYALDISDCLDDDKLYQLQIDTRYTNFEDEIKYLDIANMGKDKKDREVSDLTSCVNNVIEFMEANRENYEASLDDRWTGAFPVPDELKNALHELGYIVWDEVIGYVLRRTQYFTDRTEDSEFFTCTEHSDGPWDAFDWTTEDLCPADFTTSDSPFKDTKIECNCCGKILNQVTYEWEPIPTDPRQMELPHA